MNGRDELHEFIREVQNDLTRSNSYLENLYSKLDLYNNKKEHESKAAVIKGLIQENLRNIEKLENALRDYLK